MYHNFFIHSSVDGHLGFLNFQGIPGLFFFLQMYGLNTGHLIFLLLLSFNNTLINTYMYCVSISMFFYIYFLNALGLCGFSCTFSSCGEWGLHFVVVCGFSLRWLLIEAPSLVEHGFQGIQDSIVAARKLSSCCSWALECRFSSCGT